LHRARDVYQRELGDLRDERRWLQSGESHLDRPRARALPPGLPRLSAEPPPSMWAEFMKETFSTRDSGRRRVKPCALVSASYGRLDPGAFVPVAELGSKILGGFISEVIEVQPVAAPVS